jgi:acetyltransferase-like isoleucine patch superfamily enzyme
VKDILTLIATLALPISVKPAVLRALGHRVHARAQIGPCAVWRTRLCLGEHARIGPANLIACKVLLMRKDTILGYANILRGPFKARFGFRARVGNRNVITGGQRAPQGKPSSLLWLAEDARITGQHSIDMTRSVKMGRHTHLAGRASQVWTHGYVHAREGYDRARVDGAVFLGDNVYIGSFSCISPGSRVEDGITVGSHSSIAQHLEKPGVYVSQRLRYIDMDPYEARLAIERDVDDRLDPDVRLKHTGDGLGSR